MTTTSEIPEYDRLAWAEVTRARQEDLTHTEPGRARQRLRKMTTRASDAAREGLAAVPGGDAFADGFKAAMGGLTDWSAETAAATVPRGRIVKRHQRRGLDIEELRDLRTANLQDLDRHRPRLKLPYMSTMAVQGAAAGFAVTGGTALAGGGVVAGGVGAAPGAGLVIGALAADSVAVLMSGQRVVSHVAAYYGYDTRDPAERLVALAVLGYGTASATGRAAAYSELSRVTQALARRATWQTLNTSIVTQVVKRVYERLGLRLTQRTLGKAIPVLGVVAGAGLNAWTIQRSHDAAALLYRERWLRDRWGFEVEDPDVHDGQTEDDELIDIVGIVDDQIAQQTEPGENS